MILLLYKIHIYPSKFPSLYPLSQPIGWTCGAPDGVPGCGWCGEGGHDAGTCWGCLLSPPRTLLPSSLHTHSNTPKTTPTTGTTAQVSILHKSARTRKNSSSNNSKSKNNHNTYTKSILSTSSEPPKQRQQQRQQHQQKLEPHYF